MEFEPNILNRFRQVQIHHIANQRVFEVIQSSIYDLISLEGQLSSGLDNIIKKLNNIQEDNYTEPDVLKLIHAYRNILNVEKDQADFLKDNLKNDILILLKTLANNQYNYITLIEQKSKEGYKQMELKIKNLKKTVDNYKQSFVNLHYASDINMKDKMQSLNVNYQIQLQDAINQYNIEVDSYSEACVKQSSTYEQVQQESRICIKNIMMKLQVFHVSMIKNIEYDLTKMNAKVESFETSSLTFAYKQETDVNKLNKYYLNNYLTQIQQEALQTTKPSFNINTNEVTAGLNQVWDKLTK